MKKKMLKTLNRAVMQKKKKKEREPQRSNKQFSFFFFWGGGLILCVTHVTMLQNHVFFLQPRHNFFSYSIQTDINRYKQ